MAEQVDEICGPVPGAKPCRRAWRGGASRPSPKPSATKAPTGNGGAWRLSAGTLPPWWFIHELMKHMGRPCYVALLSAAQFHGAARHRPREFQVMIEERAVRPIRAGKVQIRFHGKGPFDGAQTQDAKTPTGMMKVATPETTAWDLVRYFKAAGGLENVVTVLSELSEKLDATRLRDTVTRHGEVIVAQRLGFLLDRAGRRSLTKGLAD